MGWKLRKDKLRADTDAAPDTMEEAAMPPMLSAAGATPPAEMPPPPALTEEVTLNPLPGEAGDFSLPPVVFDLDPTAFVPLSSLHTETPDAADAHPHTDDTEPIALSGDAETEAGNVPVFDPIAFDAEDEENAAPSFTLSDADEVADDAPVFGIGSPLATEEDNDAPAFAMGTDSDAPTFAMGTGDDAPVLAPQVEEETAIFSLGANDAPPGYILGTDEEPPAFALGTDEEPPAFDTDTDTNAPAFAMGTSDDAPAFAMGTDTDTAPVYAMNTDTDTPTYALTPPATDPQAEADDAEIPLLAPDTEPAAQGGNAGDTLGAFVPYQPQDTSAHAEDNAPVFGASNDDNAPVFGATDDDMETGPEVGAMEFNPQSPDAYTFRPDAPTAGEEISEETPPAEYADPLSTSPMAFEPAFDTPDAYGGMGLPQPDEDPNKPRTVLNADPDAPFMDREALAAGLVSLEAGSGLPRVAPFVLPGAGDGDLTESDKPQALVLHLGTLSATYPLVKDVTTIGRPDSETGNYPDVEVELDDGVSRRHAEVRREDDKYYLVDMGSTNGTRLNGEMLVPNTPEPLMAGDKIRIGERVEIVFE